MRRISITIPDKVAEALERIARRDPSNPSRSRIVSDALVRYIADLRSAVPRAPSPTLRKAKLALPKWSKIEG